MDTVSIIVPNTSFHINISRSNFTIFILKIDAKAYQDHDPVVIRDTPTNIIIPIIVSAFHFLSYLYFYINPSYYLVEVLCLR